MRGAVQRFIVFIEVLPVILVAILLNISGRYLCEYAQGHYLPNGIPLFMDMIGTAFSAIILGPWWGAVAGILSAIITGNFYENYFPFGVVNVCGALIWGYLSHAFALSRQLRLRSVTLEKAFVGFIVLLFAGAIVCGLASFLVQIVLYPPMERPLVYGVWSKGIKNWLTASVPSLSTDEWSLLIGTLGREFVDKSLTLSFAICFVALYAWPREETSSTIWERISVEALSVCSFMLVYSTYLGFARLFTPIIKFAGGHQPVEWMKYPSIIVLLYFPLLFVLVCFFWQSLDTTTIYGRTIDRYRHWRHSVVLRVLANAQLNTVEGNILKHIEFGKKMYSLIAGVLAVPLGKALPIGKSVGIQSLDIGLIYAAGAIGVVLYYLYKNYQFVSSYEACRLRLDDLRSWSGIRKSAANASRALEALASSLGGASSEKRWRPTLVYTVIETENIGPKPLSAYEPFRREIGVLVVSEGNINSGAYYKEIQALVNVLRPGFCIMLCPQRHSSDVDLHLNAIWNTGVELILLDWSSAERIVKSANNASIVNALISELRVSTGALMAGGEKFIERCSPVSWSELAARALPGLSHVIDRMEKAQLVFDLGAGRGRHTLYALRSGLAVVSVERKQDAYDDLLKYISDSGFADRARPVLADYLSINLVDYGHPDIVISTGVLQQCRSVEELRRHLAAIKSVVSEPFSQVYIEMLFDMRFDGSRPNDGRIEICQTDFERELVEAFSGAWEISLVSGPTYKLQDFSAGPRSFYPSAKQVESISIEYSLVYQSDKGW